MKLLILFCLLPVLLQFQLAHARKVALVIGNSSYAEGPLRNPVNDARLMERTLRPLGFEVKRLENLDYRGMKRAMIDFGDFAKDAEVALIYYAGHGIQQDGENWLLPIDAKINKPADVGLEALQASSLLNQLDDSRAKVGLVILDACRNNPFVSRTRSVSRGLARMDAPSGSIVAYSAQPGAVADDGTDGNGLYTKHLAANLSRKDLEIKQVFELTAIAVEKDSGRKQRPREDIGLRGSFYLSGEQVAYAVAPSITTPIAEPSKKPAIQTGAVENIAPAANRDAFGIEMLPIPAGGYSTGGSGMVYRRTGTPVEQKQVSVKAFELGATEVTNGQWRKVMGEEPRPNGTDDSPVLGRTWFQVMEFIQKLNLTTGSAYRLPTEAEWEYAARGGCTTPFNIGGKCKDDIVKGVDAMFSDGGFFELNRSVGVKSFAANSFGLYGMHGNESEWVSDCFKMEAVAVAGIFSAPTHNITRGEVSQFEECPKRIVKGGSSNDQKSQLRANSFEPHDPKTPMAGFRLARSTPH